MHVRAPYPHQLPYKIEADGRVVDNVIEANDEDGSYVQTYFHGGSILMDPHGHVVVTHKRAMRLSITPLTSHPYSVSEEEQKFLILFDLLLTNLQGMVGDFERITLNRRQLMSKLQEVLEMVLDTCAGASQLHRGVVWVSVEDRDDSGTPRLSPPSNWKDKDTVVLWEKWRRLRSPYPTYLVTDKPPVAYHPENQ